MLCAQSRPTLCNTMDIAHEVPLSIEFSRQEYWTGWSFPSAYQYYNNSNCYNWVSQVVLVIKTMSAHRTHKRSGFLIPGLGRSPGGGQSNPLQYSCMENPMDRGAW